MIPTIHTDPHEWVDLILNPLDYDLNQLSPLLHIHSTHLPPSTSPFKLPALARNVRLTALERAAKVLDGLARIPLTPEEDSVGSSRGAEGELIQSEAFPASSNDTLAGGVRKSQSGDGKLGNLWKALVVEDGAHSHDRLGVLGV